MIQLSLLEHFWNFNMLVDMSVKSMHLFDLRVLEDDIVTVERRMFSDRLDFVTVFIDELL